MYTKLVGFLIKFRVIGLIVMALLTGFFITQITKMQMFTDFLDLFPANHRYVQVHKQYSRYFGSAYLATLVLEVQEGDVYNPKTLQKIFDIHYDVDLIAGVNHFGIFDFASRRVSYSRETATGFQGEQLMKTVPQTEEEMAYLKKKVKMSTRGASLVSDDGKALRLDASFIEGQLDFNDLFKSFMDIKAKYEDNNHKIYLTGQPLLYGWIYHYLPNMATIFGVTVLIILAMLFGYMRTGGIWWIPFLTAVISAIWGLGIAAMWGFHFDPLIVVIPFLLSARAISHAVQWAERFVEEYAKRGDTKEAALVTGAGLFPPGLLGIVTDAAGLFVISLAPIPILKNLAYLGTSWAVVVIFAVLVFLPMFFAMFKSIKVAEKYTDREESAGLIKRILIKMTGWTFGAGRYIVLGVACAVLIFSIVSSSYLKYGDANPGSPIIWQDGVYNQDTTRVSQLFPGVDEMWIVFENKKGQYPAIAYPELLEGLERLKMYVMKDPNVGYAISIADMMKGGIKAFHQNEPKLEFLPLGRKYLADMVNMVKNMSAPGDLDQWTESTFSAANLKMFLKDHRGTTLAEVIGKVEGWVAENKDVLGDAVARPAGGLGGILAAANEVIEVKNHQLLLMVLGVVFVFCSLTYRSLVAGCMFVSSLVLANFLAFSYMVFKDIGLNINTLPVVSLGIGLGVDYGLYIISRIRETYAEEQDMSRAVVKGVTTAGRAVFMTATMMTAGVVFWYFSPLRFQAEMGILLGILMMSNMLVGVLVLPAIVNVVKPKFISRGL